VVVLADADKPGVECLVKFADLDEVDVLVTGARATPEQLAPLEAAGVEVVVA
jgi:DeoR family transcriptional regulator, fructose operon transcriptional repressor